MINRFQPEYYNQQRAAWKKLKAQIFGDHIPESREWTDLSEMMQVLNIIGKDYRFNHVYTIIGGCTSLRQSSFSSNPQKIVLGLPSEPEVEPLSLSFHSFESKEEFDHFRLVTKKLQASDLTPHEYDRLVDFNRSVSQEVALLKKASLEELRQNRDKINFLSSALELKRNSRGGNYIISCPVSPISLLMNENPTIHQKLSAEDYKKLIQTVIDGLKEHGR